MKRTLLSLLFLTSLAAAEPSAISLDEAISLALKQSKVAQLSQLRLNEATAENDAARRLRYPQFQAYGMSSYLFRPIELKISQGSLTSIVDQTGTSLGVGPLSPMIGQFPANDLTLVRGSRTPALGSVTVIQPLSQLWRINSGVRVAEAGQLEAQRMATQTLSQLRFSLEEIFVGILLEDRRLAERSARVKFQERRLRDAENASQAGELLDDAVLGLRAELLEAQTERTHSEQQHARLVLQLADFIGRPGSDTLLLAPQLPKRSAQPLDYWLSRAERNPDREIASTIVQKAAAGVRAARQAHIPELSLFAAGFAQNGIPLVPSNTGAVGVTLSWDIFDFGRRNADVARAVARHRASEVNRDRIEEEATRQIRIAYQDYTYAGELIDLTSQAVAFRRRAAELARQSFENHLILEARVFETEADLRKAETDLTAAQYQRHLALLHLYFLAGEL